MGSSDGTTSLDDLDILARDVFGMVFLLAYARSL